MIILGLTGSIGMGKSTTAQMFRDEGVPVYDADAAVHALYAPGGAAVAPVGAAFAGVVKDGAIDRLALRAAVGGDPLAWQRLEAIVHPLVREAQIAFLDQARRSGAKVVVLDIPLLFENGGHKAVDGVVVVTAPPAVQRQRVLDRPGMTEAVLAEILAKQVSDPEKRAMADFVVNTGFGLTEAQAQVRAILDALAEAN
ncbi:MAG: dephospho-CoA kinase [Caulobacterales bacterium]